MISVSVIIPVFNASSFLKRAVDSALKQDYVHEIILVDDGSVDDSLILCEKLKLESSKIQVYQHPEKNNKGLAATRNRGLEFVTGDWIQFLDADDELLPNKIKSQIEVVHKSGNTIPFVVGNSIDVFSDGRRHYNHFFKDIWAGLICSKLGISSANLFNYSVIKKAGFFDSSLRTSEEYNLMFKVMKLGYIPVYDSNFLTLIYKTEGSLSRGEQHRKTVIDNWLSLRIEIRNFLISKRMYSIKYDFYYSAYVGKFHKNYDIDFHPSINKLYYRLFEIILNLRSFFK